MLTQSDKFANLHAAEDLVRKAQADLVDPSTGEYIAPGAFSQDEATGSVWTNVNGKAQRVKINVVKAKS